MIFQALLECKVEVVQTLMGGLMKKLLDVFCCLACLQWDIIYLNAGKTKGKHQSILAQYMQYLMFCGFND